MTRHALPAIYYAREFAEIGGLMSYGPDLVKLYQQAGIYVGRVLKGEGPRILQCRRGGAHTSPSNPRHTRNM